MGEVEFSFLHLNVSNASIQNLAVLFTTPFPVRSAK